MNSLANTKVLYRVLCGILGTAVSGCDIAVDPNALAPSPDWEGVSCDDDRTIDLLSDLAPLEEIDGIVLAQTGVQIGRYRRPAGGKACINATDTELCNQNIDDLTQSYSENIMIVTQGDTIQVLQTEADFQRILGDLDNKQKVFSWMHVHGLRLSCTFEDSAVLDVANGQIWNGIYTQITSSCSPLIEERVRVKIDASDWSIVEFSRARIKEDEGACIGRKPPGQVNFLDVEIADISSIGNVLARHAAYEAASVIAFVHLKQELSFYNAPVAILKRIDKAIEDEKRHALQVEILAQRYDRQIKKFDVDATPIRNLEAIAIDNMKEGCIGETWGALVGLFQAEHAKDKVIATTMYLIAVDEVDHAALSWEIHDWITDQLSEEACLRVEFTKKAALASLRLKAERPVEQNLSLLAGFPEPQTSKVLVDKLIQSI